MNDDQFIRVWNEAESLGHVARRCSNKKKNCSSRAMRLRQSGKTLKRFDPTEVSARCNKPAYLPTEVEIARVGAELKAKHFAKRRQERVVWDRQHSEH